MPSDPVNEYVCAAIRRLRHERGLRVQDMSERSGIPLGSYAGLESGRYRMSLENLFRLLHALGADIGEVWPAVTISGPLTDKTIREALRKARSDQPKPPSLDEVIATVCQEFGVDVVEVLGPSRKRRLTQVRTVAAVLVRHLGHLTQVSLSAKLGRDVSSLIHCANHLERKMEFESDLRRRVDRLRRRLEQPRNSEPTKGQADDGQNRN